MCPRTRENRCNGCNTVTTGVLRGVDAGGGCNSAPRQTTRTPGGQGPSRGNGADGERVDAVALRVTAAEPGALVRGLLSRDGGHARVECGGVVVEMTVEARR